MDKLYALAWPTAFLVSLIVGGQAAYVPVVRQIGVTIAHLVIKA